ncbi:MAG: NERD domain-containing protein [Burkholderiaceae bacterium]|nr:NERD domain-containing protein [Sulfuritalea sp.]MCF8173776.1 NERD domain-containing protein [Burkholderiaceae bacterium]MCF8184932.1 NERD domain-containing protein [Polynucleobacter sp.]
MSIRSLVKGWIGEAVASISQHLHLDKNIYISLNNATLQTSNGTTQIDHIIVSKYGVFVIESKNMNGWIFGSATNPQWTQSIYGKKYKFQNPLHQNYRHTKALAEFLRVDEDKLIPFVMFWGDCEFKTDMPSNVLGTGYTSYIKKHTEVRFTDDEVVQIVEAIKAGMMPKGIIKSLQTRKEHLSSLTERHSSTSTCPKCGNPLVKRTAKKGANAGTEFLGCSGYPTCRFMRSLA